MRMQFGLYGVAIILLCICLPFGLCDKNNRRNDRATATAAVAASQNGKIRPKHGIPLRDDSDYIRENDENQRSFTADTDTDTDDDYYEGEEYYDSEAKGKSNKNKDENDVQQSAEIVEQAQSARTQIIQRPKELTEAEINALLKTVPTPSADATAPGSIEMCPKECSCLNDFMTCTRPHLKHLPKVPQYIQLLELPQNNFEAKICEDGIRNLPNLIDLKLADNKLERIPIFHGLISLETLELANNEIREIASAALQTLPKLRHLDLSRNFIIAIGPNSFPKENSLQKLFLNNNQIAKLDRRAFEPLIQLSELKINKNRITQLPTGLFTKLKKLKKLSLNGNELRTNLQYATFSNLTQLTSLKLRNNFIEELITGVFHGLDNLNLLDLANNQLSEIQKGGLLNITSLTKLNLSNNTIHTIGKNCWEFTQRITHLDLSLNQLTEISVGTFDLLSKLKVLDLHGNRISSFSSGAMNATYNLDSLDLSENRISATIEDSYAPFASLTKLDTFNLNDNHIKAINKNAFLGLTSLVRLDLNNNNITTIQDGAFRSTPELQHLHINSTDMICDCHLSWFYFWAKNTQATSGKRQSGERKTNIDVRCAFPFSLRNKRLLQLPKDNLTCNDTPKPQMIDEPKSTILAIKGTNLTIECTAFVTIGTDIIFTWKHDNTDIDAQSIETKTRRKDESRLRVKEKLVERRREVNRIPLRINFSAPKVPLASSSVSKMKYDDNDDEYEGDEEDIGSELEESEYEAESDHYDGESMDEVIATVEDIEAAIPINSTIATSRLHLTNVDARTAGRYQCIASNEFGSEYSQKFKVTVASFPVFTKHPTNVTVRTSERVRLDCAVDGDPKPQIYWTFNFGHDFPAAKERRMRIENNYESFIIDNAKASDRGVYTCTAENPAGIITANATVEIFEPLIYIKPMEHKNVIIGENAILECLASGGSALSEIRWFKNSKPILAADSRFLLAKDNQLLIIVKTTEEDGGLYTCELENAMGIEKSLIQLKVLLEQVAANEVHGYNHNEIMAIVIITFVCCAICTSVVWVVILYLTKKCNGCTEGDSSKGNGGPVNDNHLTKDCKLNSANISMLPKGDEKAIQAMRTATISRCHGVLRSNSGSSCGHSSLGVSDDIFRRYKDDGSMSNAPLHQPNRNGTDTEEDDANNDHDALLGTTYFARFPKSLKCSDNDSFVVQMDNGGDGNSSQHDTSTGNTTTAECGDFDDGLHSSTKTKTSTSLSSSCHSIPALPLNSSHEFDLNGCNESIASSTNHSPFASNQHIASNSVPNKPVIHPVPVAKTKPTIQTNKLNELMSTFK